MAENTVRVDISSGVERAIETDEATATNWINEQLEALGVELT
jgi:type I restriction enzyme M protein